jgi:hypothetical protein
MKKKSILILIFILSFLSRNWLNYEYREFDSDKCYQLAGANNLEQGLGYTIGIMNPNDLSTTQSYISGWPPGYSYLVVFLNKFTHDSVNSSILLDQLAVFIFYLSLLLFYFQYCQKINNIFVLYFLLFFGINNASFFTLGSTDFLSLSFLLISVFLFLKLLGNEKNKRTTLCFFLLTSSLPFLIKFSYLPFIFLFPIFLILQPSDKNIKLRNVKKSILLIFFYLFIASFYIWFITYSSGSQPMGKRHLETNETFHFQNLLYFNPFLFNSVLNDFFITNRLVGFGGKLYLIFKYFTTTFILIAFLNYISGQLVRRQSVNDYLLITLIVLILNVGFISFLSVIYVADNNFMDGGKWVWTYVKEFRYFAPSYFMFLLAIPLWINGKSIKQSRGLIFLLFLGFIGTLYSFVNEIRENPVGRYETKYSEFLNIKQSLSTLKVSKTNTLILMNISERPVDNTAYSSLLELDGYKVFYDFGNEGLGQRTLSGFPNNSFNATARLLANKNIYHRYENIIFIGKQCQLESMFYSSFKFRNIGKSIFLISRE